jgi:hypothetical protein
MDAAGIDHAILFGTFSTCFPIAMVAACAPERTCHLLLLLIVDCSVLDPLLSHSVGEALTGGSSYVSQSADAGGRHFESDPDRTSQRYGLAITSAYILKQALSG